MSVYLFFFIKHCFEYKKVVQYLQVYQFSGGDFYDVFERTRSSKLIKTRKNSEFSTIEKSINLLAKNNKKRELFIVIFSFCLFLLTIIHININNFFEKCKHSLDYILTFRNFKKCTFLDKTFLPNRGKFFSRQLIIFCLLTATI